MQAKCRKPVSRKLSAASCATSRGSVSSIAPFCGPVRPAKVDDRDAEIGDFLGDSGVLDASDDAVAFPVPQEIGHVVGQAPLDVQHAPPAVRTHVGGGAQQAPAAVGAGTLDQQHDSFVVRHVVVPRRRSCRHSILEETTACQERLLRRECRRLSVASRELATASAECVCT